MFRMCSLGNNQCHAIYLQYACLICFWIWCFKDLNLFFRSGCPDFFIFLYKRSRLRIFRFISGVIHGFPCLDFAVLLGICLCTHSRTVSVNTCQMSSVVLSLSTMMISCRAFRSAVILPICLSMQGALSRLLDAVTGCI